MVAPILLGAELVARRVHLRRQDIVFVKGVFEASEGVGVLFADEDGWVVLAAPQSRLAELDELIADLRQELDDVIVESDASNSLGSAPLRAVAARGLAADLAPMR